MRVAPLHPDIPAAPVQQAPSPSNGFMKALGEVSNALQRADNAENAYAGAAGSLQDAVLERARADVALAIATSVAQRTATALQSVLNLQI